MAVTNDFQSANLNLNGQVSLSQPTALVWGPDGRLYVSEVNGTIKVLTVAFGDPDPNDGDNTNQFYVTEAIELDGVKGSGADGTNYNFNDQGEPEFGKVSGGRVRQVTGIDVTARYDDNGDPVIIDGKPAVNIYVTSSDPEHGAGGSGNDVNLDTNSGTIHRLQQTGSFSAGEDSYETVDLVYGLARSEENHSLNGLEVIQEFDDVTGKLVSERMIVANGGNANTGAPSNNFAGQQEQPYSAAILEVDLTMLDGMSVQTHPATNRPYVYELPTLDDPTRAGADDNNDPFGGNDGFNSAKLTADGPVQIYSPGYRNAYDVEVTEDGRVFTYDNGANNGWGGRPVGEAGDNGGTTDFAQDPNYISTNFFNGEGGNNDDFNLEAWNPSNDDQLHEVTRSDDLDGRALSVGGNGAVATYFDTTTGLTHVYGGHPNPTRAEGSRAGLLFSPKGGVEDAYLLVSDQDSFGNGGLSDYDEVIAWLEQLEDENPASGIYGAEQGEMTQRVIAVTPGVEYNIYKLANGDGLAVPTSESQAGVPGNAELLGQSGLPADIAEIVHQANPIEGNYLEAGKTDGALDSGGGSINGLAEYTSTILDGDGTKMSGAILATQLGGGNIIVMGRDTPDGSLPSTVVGGSATAADRTVIQAAGGPLGISTVGDDYLARGLNKAFQGSIWTAVYQGSGVGIEIFQPEGTDVPLAGAVVVNDTDKDFDDIDVVNDPFEFSSTNGYALDAGQTINLDFDAQSQAFPSSFSATGFLGAALDGVTPNQDAQTVEEGFPASLVRDGLFDNGGNLIPGANAPVFQIKDVKEGSVVGAANTARDALQTGILPTDNVEKVQVTLNAANWVPGLPNPAEGQVSGMMFSDGTQSNFLRFVFGGVPGGVGFEVGFELDDANYTVLGTSLLSDLTSNDVDNLELRLEISDIGGDFSVRTFYRLQGEGSFTEVPLNGGSGFDLPAGSVLRDVLTGDHSITDSDGPTVASGAGIGILAETPPGTELLAVDFNNLQIQAFGNTIEAGTATEVAQNGTTGEDTVIYEGDDTALALGSNVENFDGELSDADYNLQANNLDNEIIVGAGTNAITTGDGSDTIQGSLGNLNGDTITDFSFQDVVFIENEFFDTVNNNFTYSEGSIILERPGFVLTLDGPDTDEFDPTNPNATVSVSQSSTGTFVSLNPPEFLVQAINAGATSYTFTVGEQQVTFEADENGPASQFVTTGSQGGGGSKIYSGGSGSGPQTIQNADFGPGALDELHWNERSSNESYYGYEIPVAQNGLYRVDVYVAEIFHGAVSGELDPGDRVMDIIIEGVTVEDNFDFANEIGASLTEEILSYTVNVQDGAFTIDFDARGSAGGSDQPKISGLALYKVGAAPADTTPPQVIDIIAAEDVIDNDSDRTVTVVASDAGGFDQATLEALDGSELSFDGLAPGSVSSPAVTLSDNDTTATLVYTIAPPSGSNAWTTGFFDVTVADGAITDAAGNGAAEATETFLYEPNLANYTDKGTVALAINVGPTTNGTANLDGSNDTTYGGAITGDTIINGIDLEADDPSYYSPSSKTGSNIDGLIGDTGSNPALDGSALHTYRDSANGSFTAEYPIANGIYVVELWFAELFWTSGGNRQGDYTINGEPFAENFDAFTAAGGADTATSIEKTVVVTDGKITIDVNADSGEPGWNAIVVYDALQSDAPATISVGDLAVTEGDDAEIVFTRTGDTTDAVEVTFTVTPNDPATAADFDDPASFTVTIPAGSLQSAPVLLPIVDDSEEEGAETLTVTITNLQNTSGDAVGVGESGTITIGSSDQTNAVPVGNTIFDLRFDLAGEPLDEGGFDGILGGPTAADAAGNPRIENGDLVLTTSNGDLSQNPGDASKNDFIKAADISDPALTEVFLSTQFENPFSSGQPNFVQQGIVIATGDPATQQDPAQFQKLIIGGNGGDAMQIWAQGSSDTAVVALVEDMSAAAVANGGTAFSFDTIATVELVMGFDKAADTTAAYITFFDADGDILGGVRPTATPGFLTVAPVVTPGAVVAAIDNGTSVVGVHSTDFNAPPAFEASWEFLRLSSPQFVVDPADTTGPSASVSIAAPATDSDPIVVTVVYSDASDIDSSTIDVNDIALSGPSDSSDVAFVFNGDTNTATYTFSAPAEGWENGTYSATVASGEVADLAPTPNTNPGGETSTVAVSFVNDDLNNGPQDDLDGDGTVNEQDTDIDGDAGGAADNSTSTDGLLDIQETFVFDATNAGTALSRGQTVTYDFETDGTPFEAGFTGALPSPNDMAVEVDLNDAEVSGGALNVTVQPGDHFGNGNTNQNAFVSAFSAPEGLSVETRFAIPDYNPGDANDATPPANFQSSGVVIGLDQNNLVKVVYGRTGSEFEIAQDNVNNNGNGSGATTPDSETTPAGAAEVSIRLEVTFGNDGEPTATGYYTFFDASGTEIGSGTTPTLTIVDNATGGTNLATVLKNGDPVGAGVIQTATSADIPFNVSYQYLTVSSLETLKITAFESNPAIESGDTDTADATFFLTTSDPAFSGDLTLDYTIAVDGEETVFTGETVTFTNGTAEITFPVANDIQNNGDEQIVLTLTGVAEQGVELADDVTEATTAQEDDAPAPGATYPFDEETDGDLSDDGLNPTDLGALSEGDNRITAVQQGDDQPGGRERDYFTFTVEEGQVVTEILIENYEPTEGGVPQGFIAIAAGSEITVDPTSEAGDGPFTELLGGYVYSTEEDVLPSLAAGESFGAEFAGFTPPLPAGTYTIWLNQGGSQSEVTLNIVSTDASALPQVSISDAPDVSEGGDEGDATLVFPLTSTVGDITVDVTYTVDGEAFTANGVTFDAAGDASLPVAVARDNVADGDDTVEVVLTGVTGANAILATVAPSATGTVTEDEFPDDIDGDSVLNIDDPFAYDGSNGLDKVLFKGALLAQEFEVDTTDPFSSEAGFTGIVINQAFGYPGTSESDPYGNRTIEGNATVANGAFTVQGSVYDTFGPGGTGNNNTLGDAYISAADVSGNDVIEITTRASSPTFASTIGSTGGFEQFGLVFGAGGVDDFAKLVLQDNNNNADPNVARVQMAQQNSLVGIGNEVNLFVSQALIDATTFYDFSVRIDRTVTSVVLDGETDPTAVAGEVVGTVAFLDETGAPVLENGVPVVISATAYVEPGSSFDLALQGQNPLTNDQGGLAYGFYTNEWSAGTGNAITANYEFLRLESLDEPPVDEAPTVALTQTVTDVDENADTSASQKVADIAITDGGLSAVFLRLEGDDATLFEIVEGTTGLELHLAAGATLDFETDAQLDVTVVAEDAAGTGSAPLTLAVLDGNDAATAVTLTPVVTELPEDTDTAVRIKVADIAITDDAFGTNVLSLSGADADAFEIDGLELFVKAGVALDFETAVQLDVTVEVDDADVGATPDATASFSLGITDVDDAPAGSVTVSDTALSNWSNQTSAEFSDAFEIADNGATLNLTGNQWKKLELDEPYTVEGGDELVVTFSSPQTGEIVGIALETDNNHQNGGQAVWQFGGSQNWQAVADRTYFQPGASQAERTVVIDLSDLVGETFTFLGFISDKDGGDQSQVEATFTNIQIRSANAANQEPTANDDALAIDADAAATIGAAQLLGNDTDPDSDPLTIASVDNAVNGTVSLSPDGLSVTFTPAAGFTGPASFDYTVSDGRDGTSTATVTLDVNTLPDVTGETVDAEVNETIFLSASELTQNDSDPDGGSVLMVSVGNAVGGAVDLEDGQVTFTPDTDFIGFATFDYTVEDDEGGQSTATVTVRVGTEIDPNAGVTDIVFEAANLSSYDDQDKVPSGATISSDGETLSLENNTWKKLLLDEPITIEDDMVLRFTYSSTDTGEIVGIGLEDDNSYRNSAGDGNLFQIGGRDATPNVFEQLPSNQRYNTSDFGTEKQFEISLDGLVGQTFSFLTFINDEDNDQGIENNGLFSNVQLVRLSATNTPPTPADDVFAVEGNTTLELQPSELLANDTDPEGNALTLISVADGTGGTVSLEDGFIFFTPDTDFAGDATFTYTVEDSVGDTAEATVTVSVNRSPVAVADSFDIGEGETLFVSTFDLVGNDNDPDGDDILVTGVSNAVGGTVTLSDEGQITFTPDSGFTGPASFDYSIEDTRGGTASGTATVNVGEVEPVDPTGTIDFNELVNTSYSDQDQSQNVSVSPDGASLTLTGNTWRKVALEAPFQVEATSTLTFDLNAIPGEIVGIGLDNDNNHTNGGAVIFQLGGSQNWSLLNETYRTYENGDGTVSFTIDLSALAGQSFQFLTLVSDQDSGSGAQATFSNVTVGAPTTTLALSGAPAVLEGDTGSETALAFTVTASDTAFSGDVAVTYTVNGGDTEMATVALLDGVGTLEVTAFQDDIADGDDTAEVVLTGTTTSGFGIDADTDTATGTVTEDDAAPVAVADAEGVESGGSVNFDPAANDTDADSAILTVVSVDDTGVTGGTVTLETDGTVTVAADEAAETGDEIVFGYTVSDDAGNIAAGTATVTVGGVVGTPDVVVLRINAFGDLVLAADGPDWLADGNGNPNISFLTVGTGAGDDRGDVQGFSGAAASVPDGVPTAVLDTARSSDSPFSYDIPVSALDGNGEYQVNLIFAELFPGNQGAGNRIFSVDVEGETNGLFDPSVGVGAGDVSVLSFTVDVADSELNIDLAQVAPASGGTDNPIINAIEIIKLGEDGPDVEAPVVGTIALTATEGAQTGTVSVALSDNVAVDATSVDVSDIVVAAPAGAPTPTVTAASFANGVATYTIDAGAGGFVAGDYTVVTATGAYADDAGNTSAPSQPAVFTVDGSTGGGENVVLLRLNTGGNQVAAVDGGVPWLQDLPANLNGGVVAGSGTADTSSEYLDPITPLSQNRGDAFGFSGNDATIPATVPDEVMDTARSSNTPFSYSIPVEDLDGNGNYTVTVYLAELFAGNQTAASRVFDISVEGFTPAIFNDVDPSALAAGPGDVAAISFNVAVDDGELNIAFSQNSPLIDNPIVNGIEISSFSGDVSNPGGQSDPTDALAILNDADNVDENGSYGAGAVGAATLTITPGGSVQTSNFGGGSFNLENTGDKQIAAVFLDFRDALYRDSVIDIDGSAGDTDFKVFNFDGSNNDNGSVDGDFENGETYFLPGPDPLDNTTGEGISDSTGGFRGLLIKFGGGDGGFAPGEEIGFSGDMDPNSVAGLPKNGPADISTNPINWDTGGVSGAELAGSKFYVKFDDGSTAVGYLGGIDNVAGSTGTAVEGATEQTASVSVNGFTSGQAGVYGGTEPVITVSGNPGDRVLVTMSKGVNPVTANGVGAADLVLARLEAAYPEFPVNNAADFQFTEVVIGAGGTATVDAGAFDYNSPAGGGQSFDGTDWTEAFETAPIVVSATVIDSPVVNGGNGKALGSTDRVYLESNGDPVDGPVQPPAPEGYFEGIGNNNNLRFKVQIEDPNAENAGQNPGGLWEFFDGPDGQGRQSGSQGDGYYLFGSNTSTQIVGNNDANTLTYTIFIPDEAVGTFNFRARVSRDGTEASDQQNDIWLNFRQVGTNADIEDYLIEGNNEPEPTSGGAIKVFGGPNNGSWGNAANWDGQPGNPPTQLSVTEGGLYEVEIIGRSQGFHVDFWELYKGGVPGTGASNSPFIATGDTNPTVTDPIDDLILALGEDALVNAAAAFTDLDGDDLDFVISAPNSAGEITVDEETGAITIGDGLGIGTYTVTVTASDDDTNTATDTFTVTVQEEVVSDGVLSFAVRNGDDGPIVDDPLQTGDVIGLGDFDGTIEFNGTSTTGQADFGSSIITLLEADGDVVASATESLAPFDLIVATSALSAGAYTLRAENFAENGGNGASLGVQEFTFSVTDGTGGGSGGSGQPGVLTKAIVAGSDDTDQNSGGGQVNITKTDLELGDSGRDIGLRFTDLDLASIGPNADITDAYIQFTARPNGGNSGTINAVISLEDSLSAATFSDGSGPAQRDTFETTTVWTDSDVPSANQEFRTANFADMLEDFLDDNAGGLSSSDELAFIIEDTSGVRKAVSFEGDMADAAVLVVEFDLGVA